MSYDQYEISMRSVRDQYEIREIIILVGNKVY